jgi:hypothetical protein
MVIYGTDRVIQVSNHPKVRKSPKSLKMPKSPGNAQKQGLLEGSSAGAYRTLASQIEAPLENG